MQQKVNGALSEHRSDLDSRIKSFHLIASRQIIERSLLFPGNLLISSLSLRVPYLTQAPSNYPSYTTLYFVNLFSTSFSFPVDLYIDCLSSSLSHQSNRCVLFQTPPSALLCLFLHFTHFIPTYTISQRRVERQPLQQRNSSVNVFLCKNLGS